MSSSSLREFVSHTREAGRIGFGDLRRLQRDILPDRITTREEAELLLTLDRVVRKADRDWNDYLVGAVRNFVVWGMEPAGSLDDGKVEWLMSVLSKPTTKAGHALAREITGNPLWWRV
jgi:hypothetical protein